MRRFLSGSFLLAVALYVAPSLRDPDLWWHVVIGRWMVAHRALPSVDYWNAFAAGEPWRAYSWSNEVIYAAVEGALGLSGLLFLQVFLSLALVLICAFVFSNLSKDGFFGTVLGGYVALACYTHFGLRPQTASWICFLATLFAAELVRKSGFSLGRGGMLFAIGLVWANTHITPLLGIVAAMIWVIRLAEIRATAGLAMKVGGACFLGTLVTPYFGGEWISLFEKGYFAHPVSHNFIAEFQPVTILQYSTGFALLLVSVWLFFLHHRPRALDPLQMILPGVFVLAGLAASKFLPYALMLVAFELAHIWGLERKNETAFGNLGRGIHLARQAISVRTPCLVLSLCFLISAVQSAYALRQNPVDETLVPVQAVNFILEKELAYPILNFFGDGGYLIYRLADGTGTLRQMVTMDGRTNVMPPDLIEAFLDAAAGRDNWRDYFDKVKPETVLIHKASPLTTILREVHEWCLVYIDSGERDQGRAVFVKRDFLENRRLDFSSPDCPLP